MADKCLFCGKEIAGKGHWCGPHNLGMHFCNYDCYLGMMHQKYPWLFEKHEEAKSHESRICAKS